MECQALATKTVSEWFSKEILDGYVQSSVNKIAAGQPVIDGKKNIAALHYYDTEHGKIGVFTTWVKGTPMAIYVGTEREIIDIKSDFQRLVEESGFSFQKSPREKAEKRKKERKKFKRE